MAALVLYLKDRRIRNTAWKVSAFGVFLVRIFPNSDWEKLQIRTLFCQVTRNLLTKCHYEIINFIHLFNFLSWHKVETCSVVNPLQIHLLKRHQFGQVTFSEKSFQAWIAAPDIGQCLTKSRVTSDGLDGWFTMDNVVGRKV